MLLAIGLTWAGLAGAFSGDKDKDGKVIPRSIINRFVADFNDQNLIDVILEPAISTNPYFKFEAIVPESGEFKFTWYDDDGAVYEAAKKIKVS